MSIKITMLSLVLLTALAWTAFGLNLAIQLKPTDLTTVDQQSLVNLVLIGILGVFLAIYFLRAQIRPLVLT